MSTKKVYIDMDQMFVWYIPGVTGYAPYTLSEHSTELNEKWLKEFERVGKQYNTKQRVLEHLYRVREGLRPFELTEEEKKELEKATLKEEN